MTKLAPILALSNAVFQFACSAAYFTSGDIRRGVYWMAATILTLAVTL